MDECLGVLDEEVILLKFQSTKIVEVINTQNLSLKFFCFLLKKNEHDKDSVPGNLYMLLRKTAPFILVAKDFLSHLMSFYTY